MGMLAAGLRQQRRSSIPPPSVDTHHPIYRTPLPRTTSNSSAGGARFLPPRQSRSERSTHISKPITAQRCLLQAERSSWRSIRCPENSGAPPNLLPVGSAAFPFQLSRTNGSVLLSLRTYQV